MVDAAGNKRWEGKVATDPDLIVASLRERAGDVERVGLETGPLCVWLWHRLREAGVPVVALHALQAAAALSLQANKQIETTPRDWRSW